MPVERAIRIECVGVPTIGIVHLPDGEARTGVLVVVGGPQYRVGSHRQFVLLSRHLAQAGVAAFRFDYRGIGDSVGEARNFLTIEDDIRAAIDAFRRECQGLKEIYLWGLCDAASAALLFAHRVERIAGLVLCNPWVRTESTYARTIVKDYYGRQVFSAAVWRRLINGELDLWRSLVSFAALLRASLARTSVVRKDRSETGSCPRRDEQFPARMLFGLQSFTGRVLLILSGNDLTAAEFENLVRSDREWTSALRQKQVVVRRLPQANHTFSTRASRDQVASWTAQWVQNRLPDADLARK
jgi:exosortase A-associated hydrolase 1